VLVGKRKFIYEREIAADPYNYDSWMDYIQLLTSSVYSSTSKFQNDPLIAVDKANLIQLYEKSIATVPSTTSKTAWKRYIYLWLRYAYHMELNEKNTSQTRAIYEKCVQLVPHERFSFRKIWIAWAEFEIRAGSITNARNVLVHAIGLVPHPKLFTYYADLEMQLGEIDHVRKIYEKWLECSGGDQAEVWCIYTDLEERMEEFERMRALYEMALTRTTMDRPELIWKAYIDAEKRCELHEELPNGVLSTRVCNVYDRLLNESAHARVFISYAEYEVSRKQWERARAVYDRGDTYFRHAMVTCSDQDRAEIAEQRYVVLNDWLQYEQRFGTEKDQADVRARMPTIVTKKREIGHGVLEDYNEYLYPEQQAAQSLAKARMLELAKKWRAEQMQKSAGQG
jgi:crooked neck